MLTSKGQGQNLTSGQGHGVTQVAYESMRIDETNTFRSLHLSSSSQSQVIGKKTVGDLG